MIHILSFLHYISESPKRAAEAGGATGFFVGLVSYWTRFSSSTWGEFVIGAISTVVFASLGAAASFLTTRYFKKKLGE